MDISRDGNKGFYVLAIFVGQPAPFSWSLLEITRKIWAQDRETFSVQMNSAGADTQGAKGP